MTDRNQKLEWYRVADVDELPESRVKTVTAGIHLAELLLARRQVKILGMALLAAQSIIPVYLVSQRHC